MPSGWLEDDEYEAWAAEIELSESQAQPQTSNTTSTTTNQAASHQLANPPSNGFQQAGPARFAGSYQPYSASQSEDDAEVDPREYPPDDINDEQQADTPQQYSSEVPDSPALPASANRESRPSDIDSLFGDSGSEAGAFSPPPQAQQQTQAQAQPRSTTPVETPPAASPAPSVPTAQSTHPAAGGGGGGSLLGSLFDDQGWDKESLGDYNPKFQRRDKVPSQRWFEKQRHIPMETDKEKGKGGEPSKDRAGKGPSTQSGSAPQSTDEGDSANNRAAEDENAEYAPPEDYYVPEEPGRNSFQTPYGSEGDSDEEFADDESNYPEEYLQDEEQYDEDEEYLDEQDQNETEVFPGRQDTNERQYQQPPQDTYKAKHQQPAPATDEKNHHQPGPAPETTKESNEQSGQKGTKEQDRSAGQEKPSSEYDRNNPPEWYLLDHHPWAHLRDAYNPETETSGPDPLDSPPSGFAQYASGSTWAPPPRKFTDAEMFYARFLWQKKMEAHGRDPYDPSKPWHDRRKDPPPPDPTESDEEMEWFWKEMEKKREEDHQFFGKGGPRDQSLWTQEQIEERDYQLSCELFDQIDEKKAREKREKEEEEKKAGGKNPRVDEEVKQKRQITPKPMDRAAEMARRRRDVPVYPDFAAATAARSTMSSSPTQQPLRKGEVPGLRSLHRSNYLNFNSRGIAWTVGVERARIVSAGPVGAIVVKLNPCQGHRRSQVRSNLNTTLVAVELVRIAIANLESADAAKLKPRPSHVDIQRSRPLHLKLSDMIEAPAAGSTTPLGTPPLQSGGIVQTTTAPQLSRQNSVPPSRPDTPRPPVDSTPSIPYAADVFQEYAEQPYTQRSPDRHAQPSQSVEAETTTSYQDGVRQSVEPEYPPPNWQRDTTPAYEDRSFTPSPFSQPGDVEMRDASGSTIVPTGPAREGSVAPSNPEDHRQPSAHRPVPPPIPSSSIQQPKRGDKDKKKSGVQSGKIDKRTATGSKPKPKSRNTTRKPNQSVGKLVEKAKKESKEAAEEAEAGPFNLKTPTKPAPKAGGKVAEAVKKIEKQVQQQEEKDLKQKDGTPVRRSGRANKGVRTSLGYGTP
ncbi:hypothetical protein H2200_006474 [Cladophialophora chaetospira]|uniref:Uncharacterized protein n=1 Tax=Cladophialophora chaetospira TaxID=386627 RepID=A0AA38X896_9EURO|nr:hypothetical protein H2200_006474 [Cladophialophora chaetospira]